MEFLLLSWGFLSIAQSGCKTVDWLSQNPENGCYFWHFWLLRWTQQWLFGKNHNWGWNKGQVNKSWIKGTIQAVDATSLTETTQKFNQTLPTFKIMASVFWDWKYVLLVDFMKPVATITANHYCTTLRKLKKAIKLLQGKDYKRSGFDPWQRSCSLCSLDVNFTWPVNTYLHYRFCKTSFKINCYCELTLHLFLAMLN